MQAVPAALSYIGGGSIAAGTVIAATAATGVYSAVASHRAGKIAQQQAEINAKAEGDAARGREIERKRALLRSVSARQAAAGAAGVSFQEGSPAAITQLDIARAQDDLVTDRANSAARRQGYISQGRAARFAGDTRAVTTLLDTATNIANVRLR